MTVGAPGGDDQQQGLSIWIFIVAFTALAVIGLVVVLIVGSPTSGSRPAKTATDATAPAGDAQRGDTPRGDEESTTTADRTTATLPDGSRAPTGVSRVESDDGVLTLVFSVDRSELSSTVLAKVPPIEVVADADSSGLDLTIRCSSSSREQLSQVTVSETDTTVRVSAVVLVPTNAIGCNPNDRPRRMTLPLESPLGERTVSIESEDLDLPPVDIDSIDD